MSEKATTSVKNSMRKAISFSSKFGLDHERKKIGIETDEKAKPPTVSVGEDFEIINIKMTNSKRKYNKVNEETDEIEQTRIPIAQMDIRKKDGTIVKVYSPNSAIVESCNSIMNDPEFEYNKETGEVHVPCLIHSVISGKGDNKHEYLAFQ